MYIRVSYPKIQCFDNAGLLAVGFKIYTYAAGTVSTPAASYSDRNLTVPNTNPVILNSRGEADIYTGVALKLVFTTPTGDPGSPIWSVDYVGEQQSTFLTGSATPGTVNNNYVVAIAPPPAALTNNLMLIFTPDTDNVDTIGTQVFTGTGINDGVFTGPYIGSTAGSTFTYEIDATGTPDTFKWRKDGGAWTDGVAITAAKQNLIEGVAVTFAQTTGHTLGDKKVLTVTTPARLNLSALGNIIIYKNMAGNLKALDGKDLKQDYPATVVYSLPGLCWVLMNPFVPVFTSLIPQRIRKEVTATYAVVLADQGTELSCNGTFTVNLPACASVPHTFYYVKNKGSGVITIQANGAEKIYGYGITSYLLGSGSCIQIATNGVDWHVLAEVGGVPAGVISAFGGATTPVGYLLCDGTAVSRTTYESLFSVIGVVYGVGDGVTTFNVPDLRQRFPLGKAASGTGSTLGGVGGVIDHSHSQPTHTHGLNTATTADGTVPSVQVPQSVQAGGGDATGTNNPPFQVVNYIIKY